MTIDKQTLQAFREDFKAATAELEKKYNISISLGNISYTETEFHGKLTANSKDVYANTLNNKLLDSLGAKFTIGDKFVYKNAEFEVIGYNGKKPKMPVMLRNTQTGNQASCTVNFVNSFINNSVH